MAKPRVFISSTYYDLKHIRSSVDVFIESLGYESILSEKGDIAYMPDAPLDESCYREVSNTDVFVLIVGGRYGSRASGADEKSRQGFFERYDSITRKEYEEAIKRGIPTYILIESNVYSEYQTYLRNKTASNIQYAHVDSINIFILIEFILSRPKNNPVFQFEKFSQIESWLREQWAGLFRELLQRLTSQEQLANLSSQINDLKAVGDTLKNYLEAVVRKVSPNDSQALIATEEKKLEEHELTKQISKKYWITYVREESKLSANEILEAMRKARTFNDFAEKIGKVSHVEGVTASLKSTLNDIKPARDDFNEVRKMLNLPKIRKPRTRKPEGDE